MDLIINPDVTITETKIAQLSFTEVFSMIVSYISTGYPFMYS